MLISYFLRSFIYYGCLLLVLLTGIFASCNIFIRLPFIHDATTVPLLMLTMVPLMLLFALPLASSLAVAITMVQHKAHDQLLFFSFLKNARMALSKAVVLFSLISCCLYVIIVFQLAPQSYHKGKSLLLKAAQEHLLTLEPNKFHTPFSSFTFFFKQKEAQRKKRGTLFTSLFLVYVPKKNNAERYFFTAQKGFFDNNKLSLINGSIYTVKDRHFHTATFRQTDIDLNTFMDTEHEGKQLSGLKFFTWKRLIRLIRKEPDAYIELHKRIAQTGWQFAMPLLAYWWVTMLNYKSLLAATMICGWWYLASYVLVALAQAYFSQSMIALALFYIPIIVSLLLSLCLFRRRQL